MSAAGESDPNDCKRRTCEALLEEERGWALTVDSHCLLRFLTL